MLSRSQGLHADIPPNFSAFSPMPFRLRYLLTLLFAVYLGQSLHAEQTDSTSTH